jgi:hypothetical protein
LRRTRIAAAMGIAALATVGSLFGTGTAQASTPNTPYMCPYYIDNGSVGLYSWLTGQGYLVCTYAPPQYVVCRYNAYTGTPTSPSTGAPLNNPSDCQEDAIPTTS